MPPGGPSTSQRLGAIARAVRAVPRNLPNGTAPKVQDAVVNAAYKLTPGSGERRRDGDGG